MPYHRQQNKCYPKRCLLTISKLHSILAVANLLPHANTSQKFVSSVKFHYRVVQLFFSDNLKPFGVSFILLPMVHLIRARIQQVVEAEGERTEWIVCMGIFIQIVTQMYKILYSSFFINVSTLRSWIANLSFKPGIIIWVE